MRTTVILPQFYVPGSSIAEQADDGCRHDSQLTTAPKAAILQFIEIQKTVTERVASNSATIKIKQFLQLVDISGRDAMLLGAFSDRHTVLSLVRQHLTECFQFVTMSNVRNTPTYCRSATTLKPATNSHQQEHSSVSCYSTLDLSRLKMSQTPNCKVPPLSAQPCEDKHFGRHRESQGRSSSGHAG